MISALWKTLEHLLVLPLGMKSASSLVLDFLFSRSVRSIGCLWKLRAYVISLQYLQRAMAATDSTIPLVKSPQPYRSMNHPSTQAPSCATMGTCMPFMCTMNPHRNDTLFYFKQLYECKKKKKKNMKKNDSAAHLPTKPLLRRLLVSLQPKEFPLTFSVAHIWPEHRFLTFFHFKLFLLNFHY